MAAAALAPPLRRPLASNLAAQPRLALAALAAHSRLGSRRRRSPLRRLALAGRVDLVQPLSQGLVADSAVRLLQPLAARLPRPLVPHSNLHSALLLHLLLGVRGPNRQPLRSLGGP